MEHLDVTCRFEATGASRFRGVAVVFGNLIDTFPPTRVLRGAFRQTLASTEERNRVKVLLHHDARRVAGLPVSMRETDEGLDVTFQLGDTEAGLEARELLRPLAGVHRPLASDLSIGFDPIRWTMEEGDSGPVRHIHAARLWEFSLVTWGADNQAGVREAAARGAITPEAAEALVDAAREELVDIARLEMLG